MPISENNFPVVGVIGAGQLARMMVAPANALGITLKVFAQSPKDSAAQICDHVVGDYRDLTALLNFAQGCQVITFEHELVPPNILTELEIALSKKGTKVFPSAKTFLYSQNKLYMREEFEKVKIASPRWISYPKNSITNFTFPLIAKTPTGGYDGRGVWQVNTIEELSALHKKINAGDLLVEEKVDFEFEISVLVARSAQNETRVWSPTLSIQREGICVQTITPAPDLSNKLFIQAQEIAIKIADRIKLIGVMAVELFVIDARLLVNEIALRPHNTGHWSIEGSVTSQFEQHLRAVLNLPLGDTSMSAKWVVMGNLIGGNNTNLFQLYQHLLASIPNLKVHQYQKEVRPGRKIGHVTIKGSNLAKIKRSIEDAVDFFNGTTSE